MSCQLPKDGISNRAYLVSLASLVLTLGLVVGISLRGKPVVVKTNMECLPMQIAGLQAVEDFYPDSVYKELNADLNLYRHYHAGQEQVDLYIGYYGTAKGGRTSHNPMACMPSQGWGLRDVHEEKLISRFASEGVSVNYLFATKGDTSATIIYWYQSAGTKTISKGITQNFERFGDMILRNRNDGAYIQVTVLADKKDAGLAARRALSFSEQIVNLLPDYWPLEQ